MKLTFMHQQHTKCLNALNMIFECDRRIGSFKKNLVVVKRTGSGYIHETTRDHCEKMITHYTAVKNRLKVYYSNQFMKMVDMIAQAANM